MEECEGSFPYAESLFVLSGEPRPDSLREILGLYLKRLLRRRRFLFCAVLALQIQRFEGSRPWACDAMGFESTLTWELLKEWVVAGRRSNGSPSIQPSVKRSACWIVIPTESD